MAYSVDSSEIIELIRGWIKGCLSSPGQTRLIRIAAEIVLQRLRSRIAIACRIQDFEPTELALWAVTELFASGPGPNSTLAKSWYSATPQDIPSSIISWLESRVVQSAKHELQRLIAENDPYEYRLRRRILRVLRRDPTLTLFPGCRPEYVCLREEMELNSHLPWVNQNDIREATGSVCSDQRELPESLIGIVRTLCQRSDRCRAIPLWALCECVIEYELSKALVEYGQHASDRGSIDPALAAEVEDATAKSVEGMTVLFAKYLRLRRLTPVEVHRMRSGIETYLREFALQGDGAHLPTCLQENWPGLTIEMYKTKYAKMFEYMTSIARARFVAYWRQGEENSGVRRAGSP